jgi:hypothetical protein
MLLLVYQRKVSAIPVRKEFQVVTCTYLIGQEPRLENVRHLSKCTALEYLVLEYKHCPTIISLALVPWITSQHPMPIHTPNTYMQGWFFKAIRPARLPAPKIGKFRRFVRLKFRRRG